MYWLEERIPDAAIAISMASYNTAASPGHQQRRYHSLARSNQYALHKFENHMHFFHWITNTCEQHKSLWVWLTFSGRMEASAILVMGRAEVLEAKIQWAGRCCRKKHKTMVSLWSISMHHSLQIMFILPLMTGHLFWKAVILGGLYRGVPLYIVIIEVYLVKLSSCKCYVTSQLISPD